MHDATGTGAIVPIHRQISNDAKGNIMASISITGAKLELIVDDYDYVPDLLMLDSTVDLGDEDDFAMDIDIYEWYRDRIADAKRILAALEGEELTQFIDEVLVHEFTDDTIDAWLERTGC